MIDFSKHKKELEKQLSELYGQKILVSIRIADPPKKIVTIPEILTIVKNVTGYRPEVIRGKNKRGDIPDARHIAMTLAYEHSGKTLEEIAAAFWRNDHSTVIHARKKVYFRLRTKDDRVTNWYNNATNIINGDN